jgi:uncharacterized protein YjdB
MIPTLPRLRRIGILAALVAPLLACGGGGGGGPSGPPGTDTNVASVTATAPSATLAAGTTLQLSASARNAAGGVVSGKSFSWATSDAGIATVSGTGLVTGVAAGAVTLSATEPGSGRAGSVSVTVTPPPVPVATVAIGAFPASVLQASSTQLAASLQDADGATLTGRAVAWTSSDNAVATVSASGVLTAVAVGGPVTITATAEGKSATAQVSVTPRTAARVGLQPDFVAVNVAADRTIAALAFDASDVAIPNPVVTWTTAAAATAAVSEAGMVHGVAAGVTTLTARVNDATASAAVAVLGARDLLSTALVGGAYTADVTPGQTITVPIVLDLSRASATGDLGAAQLELTYDASVLTYVSAQANATGSSTVHSPSAGSVRFSLAHTAAQGQGSVTLVTVTFTVAAGATVGDVRTFGLAYAGPPASTTFESYSTPIVVGGRIRVVAP